MMKHYYRCVIESDSSYKREYVVATSSAIKCAKDLGRCESGEIVTVYTLSKTKAISQARWTPEDGGKYYRAAI